MAPSDITNLDDDPDYFFFARPRAATTTPLVTTLVTNIVRTADISNLSSPGSDGGSDDGYGYAASPASTAATTPLDTATRAGTPLFSRTLRRGESLRRVGGGGESLRSRRRADSGLSAASASTASTASTAATTQPDGGSECRLAWVWVEGWRARLRHAGDAVEQSRFDVRGGGGGGSEGERRGSVCGRPVVVEGSHKARARGGSVRLEWM
jgi:hypothetical protein